MGVWRTDFRFPASKVPFSEVAKFRALSYESFKVRILKEEGNWGKLLDGDATPNLERLHEVRLTALLHNPLEEENRRLLSSWESIIRP